MQAMRPLVLRSYLERLADPRFLARDAIRAAARALGCADTAVRRYLQGDRSIPAVVAARILGATESPIEDTLNRRFGRGRIPESPDSDAPADEPTKDFRSHPGVGEAEEVA